MNPFNVDRFSKIVLNFDFLDMAVTPRAKLIKFVLQTVRDRFESVNAIVTTEKIPGAENVKEIFIHNDGGIPNHFGANPHDYGSAMFDHGEAQVYVDSITNDINPESFEHMAQSVSTVTAHEGAHLLSPRAHSLYDDNLLSEHLRSSLLNDGGASLQFTQEQVQLMNWGIAVPEEMTQLIYGNPEIPLSYWEHILEKQNAMVGSGQPDFASSIDPELWGSFEPEVIGSLEGISGLEEFADIESLGALTDTELSELSTMADGIFENLGDFLGEIDYGEIIDGLSNLL